MGFIYYYIIGLLPLLVFVFDAIPRRLNNLQARLPVTWVALFFCGFHGFAWMCALGMLPHVDEFVFGRGGTISLCELLSPQSCRFWHDCDRFGPFIIDEYGIIVLFFAACVFWGRIFVIGKWDAGRFVALGCYVLLLEEIRYQPFSYFLTTGANHAFSVHSEVQGANPMLNNLLIFCLVIFFVFKVACWFFVRDKTKGEHFLLCKLRLAFCWVEQVSVVYGVFVFLSLLSTGAFLRYFSSEENKYRDFDQTVIYFSLLLIAVTLPARDIRKMTCKKRFVMGGVFVGFFVICLVWARPLGVG